jgi:ATP/maltotriose-dependent transcriptional regulator MalT
MMAERRKLTSVGLSQGVRIVISSGIVSSHTSAEASATLAPADREVGSARAVVVSAKEIPRGRLSEIVLRRVPRLVVVSAPAGYGKSTFVRQLLARFEGWAVCDCLTVRDEMDLARAVLAALAAARPALADAIAQAQLGAANDPRDWEAVASHFLEWRRAEHLRV